MTHVPTETSMSCMQNNILCRLAVAYVISTFKNYVIVKDFIISFEIYQYV